VTRFGRVLVANRGEIAVRITRACRDEGLASVAVYADPDADAPFVRLADESVALGASTAGETYLDIAAVLAAAASSGADAVHPGYGFLAENADFAQAVLDAGLVWIGPPPPVIRALGDKVRAREIAASVGAPLTAGSDEPLADAAAAIAFADEHGLPIAIKAAHGGGGRGMRIARERAEIAELFDAAVREATAAFGRGECFVEAYVEHGRHVEAQVLADADGHVVVIGTRDCTLQRRYQKLVEEAPAPFLTDGQRDEIEQAATAICAAAGYVNAATVEFLLAPSGALSFLEVNTRLQVEHSVTEESTDIDIVRAQLRIAAGDPLDVALAPSAVGPARRHAIEFRINAEDPAAGFVPATGTITRWSPPTGPGVRLDSGVVAGSVVGGQFDSLLAKLVVTGRDRTQALQRARRALDEFDIGGPATTLPFCRAVLDEPSFSASDAAGFTVHTRWIDDEYRPASPTAGDQDGPLAVRIGGRWLTVALPGLSGATSDRLVEVRAQARERLERAVEAGGDTISAPMQGTITKVDVGDGDEVAAGDLVAVVEAMKMENQLRAPHAGSVSGLRVAVGDTVAQGAAICRITPA
jgi:acetyl-CoA/propionyl-CoA carboxylase biotin carboxyl carrier protein